MAEEEAETRVTTRTGDNMKAIQGQLKDILEKLTALEENYRKQGEQLNAVQEIVQEYNDLKTELAQIKQENCI